MPEPGHKLQSADRYWEIQLAWSEYENGRWNGKKLSEAVAFEAYQGEDNVLFGPRIGALQNTVVFLRPRNDDGSFPEPHDGGDGTGGDSGDDSPPPANPSAPPRRLVAKELFSFKALISGDTLIVRGFLRRDYRKTPDIADAQISCCFGEFRFFGCRKIVTTAHRGKITDLNFPLAPSGTKFDHMWFTGVTTGLTLFDGRLPAGRPGPDVTDVIILEEVNAQPLLRLFSLRHEFPSEWRRFISSTPSAVNTITVDLATVRFPYFAQSRTITVKTARVVARTKSAAAVQAAIAPGQATSDLTQSAWTGQGAPGLWTVATSSDPKLVEDVFVIFAYGVN